MLENVCIHDYDQDCCHVCTGCIRATEKNEEDLINEYEYKTADI